VPEVTTRFQELLNNNLSHGRVLLSPIQLREPQ